VSLLAHLVTAVTTTAWWRGFLLSTRTRCAHTLRVPMSNRQNFLWIYAEPRFSCAFGMYYAAFPAAVSGRMHSSPASLARRARYVQLDERTVQIRWRLQYRVIESYNPARA